MNKLFGILLIVSLVASSLFGMKIPNGSTDKWIYFIAVDATDMKTLETGFSSFTVYYSINAAGASGTAMTTPTINETDSTNMAGAYELLIDEADMTTIDTAGDDNEELLLYITHAGMRPVIRAIEIYRPKITEGQTQTTQTGDTYALASNGTYGFSALEALVDDIGVAGAGLTAINLPNQVMDISGNITGNLSGSVGSVSADVTTDSASRTASKADVSGLSTHDAAAVWSVVTRILTASTNFNDLSAAQVNTEVDNALNTAIPGTPTANSINERIKALDDAYTTTRAGYLDALNGHTAQTGDTYALANSGTYGLSALYDILTNGTYGLSAIRTRGDEAWLSGAAAAVTTDVAVSDTTTSFTLTAGTPAALAYPDMQITVTDADGNSSIETRRISNYTNGRVITVDSAFSFTPAVGDVVVVEQAYLGVSATATIPPRIY